MRVIVNRIWKGHFGTGIVDSPSNFGTTGERPTNPDLLEYLASSFVKNGLSIKKLHREIMLSSVYQLSSDLDEANAAKDSGNRSYWRFDRKRLEAEQLRDAVLLISGNLDKSLGGPSTDLTPAFTRRTVYGKVSRYKLDEYLQLFDFPAPNISAEKRFTTTVPLQRLFLMNSDFMQAEAEQLAKRVATEPDNRSRIRKAYLLVYGRDPSEQEIKLGIEYLHAEPMREFEENKNKPPEGGPRRWTRRQGRWRRTPLRRHRCRQTDARRRGSRRRGGRCRWRRAHGNGHDGRHGRFRRRFWRRRGWSSRRRPRGTHHRQIRSVRLGPLRQGAVQFQRVSVY